MKSPFTEGDPIWIEEADGSRRPAVFIGEADQATWFGGGPGVYIVFTDTRQGAEVGMERVLPRDDA